MSQKQTQVQIQTRVRLFDDVFHNTIIALERLEGYLINKKLSDKKSFVAVTAIGTERDNHDDVANPPTEESMFAEMQLQCSALWFQTKTDGDERLEKTVRYFMKDLLCWYGGRKNFATFDEVEMFFVPLVGSLSRQIQSVADITAIVNKYVTNKIRSLDDYSDDEKAVAVEKGFLAWIQGQAIVDERKEQYDIEGDNFELTQHQRGTSPEGYIRLQLAMQQLYPTDDLPSKLLESIVDKYLPELKADVSTPEMSAQSGQDEPLSNPGTEVLEHAQNGANDKALSDNNLPSWLANEATKSNNE